VLLHVQIERLLRDLITRPPCSSGVGPKDSDLRLCFWVESRFKEGRGAVTDVVLSLLLIGIINNVLTLAEVASEVLRIVTGSLLIISILLPN
jgi:hypothetical protein